MESLPDEWTFAEEKNGLKRIDISLDLKEKVERLPSSVRFVDDAWIKLLDEPAVVAIGYDEFMNLPIHETCEASAGRCNSPYVGSIRSTVGTTISTGQLLVMFFGRKRLVLFIPVPLVSNVLASSRSIRVYVSGRTFQHPYPIIAVIAPKTLV